MEAMKVLVCGNGPRTERIEQNLDGFDHVVRINQWKKHIAPDSRCDGWAFYPWHHKGEESGKYDINDYLPVAHIWMPHAFFFSECWHMTGQYPTVQITRKTSEILHKEVGYERPTTGIVVLKMAINMGFDVTATGFNFYDGEIQYEGHRPDLDKKWFYAQIENGKLKGED